MSESRDRYGSRLGADLQVLRQRARGGAGGTWVEGEVQGCRFSALVFPERPHQPEWGLHGGRVSKLWLQRLQDRTVVFEWDRGLVREAADDRTEALVALLAEALPEHVYAR